MQQRKVGTRRNDLCLCGSGRKFKRCCILKHRLLREARPEDRVSLIVGSIFGTSGASGVQQVAPQQFVQPRPQPTIPHLFAPPTMKQIDELAVEPVN